MQIVLDEATLALPLAGIIDMAAEQKRLKREIDKVGSEIRQLDAKLANEKFVAARPSMWSRSSASGKQMPRRPPQARAGPETPAGRQHVVIPGLSAAPWSVTTNSCTLFTQISLQHCHCGIFASFAP